MLRSQVQSSWDSLRARRSRAFPKICRCPGLTPSATSSRRHYAPSIVAQTKRRRRTKHRGNAAGVVEARGRTGRKPTAAEHKPARGARPHRLDKPPTWRGAFNRAIVAVLIFAAVLAIIPSFRSQLSALALLIPFMLVIYVPLGYYTDRW